MTEGVIVRAMSGTYTVRTPEETLVCKPRGKFRLDGITPLVGDKALLKDLTVWELGARKNVFERPPVANVDIIALLASGAIPVTDPFVLDKMIAISELRGCEPLIVVNKADLDTADELYSTYKSIGFTTVRVSAITGEGLSELRAAIDGKLCAFTGNSGVGKSSVLNALTTLNLPIGEVSRKLGRGRHTTRHTELYELPPIKSGDVPTFVIDTAGFSKLESENLTIEDVAGTFREFEPYEGECRFSDCRHLKEPDCAVIAALEAGKIAHSRHQSYIRLCEEAE
ncbi:MAG: ribosome small subunit-dependent GTPase A, partial [Oscillospiraceae bacterium]|nr:ribosome small subunit-dependent GTPase A [Oscillospiraceae bacterium]